MTSGEIVTTFAVNTFEPVPDKPGYQRLKEKARVIDLIRAVNDHLKRIDVQPDEYDFSVWPWLKDEEQRLPADYRWLIAFAAEGGSEGYYVHLGAMMRDAAKNPTWKLTENDRIFRDYGCAKCNSAENDYAIAREVQRFLSAAEWNQ